MMLTWVLLPLPPLMGFDLQLDNMELELNLDLHPKRKEHLKAWICDLSIH
uniref:Uncharacterized protein n=2 Tax=Picea TaxID=3328 RepID=A0A124GPA4_PICGL|nr:hypothetical protein ABT39_MTgene1213 [Picea glauca]QHR92862.1 hypothetical protein Q903MT_gene6910 [Picea sitchensis]